MRKVILFSGVNSMELFLRERMRRILEAVVEDYTLSGEPVGSKTISAKSNLQLSPATIRNIMAELEELGLLCQTHPSAGRIPTEKGLRFYLDYILRVHELGDQEQQEIRSRYLGHGLRELICFGKPIETSSLPPPI